MPILTTSVGTPVDDDRNTLTAGERGPALLSDFHYIDKISHFDRERVPERVVHAKGSGAYGYFEVTHDISHLTRAKFLSSVGKRTPLVARFSTVGGEKGSADTARDPRGFALKFYTEEGNYDMVGNNTPVFFIRDPLQFPDFIHTQKRNPQTDLKDPDAFWDFLSLVPESLHQVTILFSSRGTPKGYVHMHGFGSHTFKLVDDQGNFKYIKWHFKTDQGIENFNGDEAKLMEGQDPDHDRRDLFNRIANGNYPSWTAYIQVMDPEDASTYRWNPFDVTKVWPKKDYPLQPVGKMVLNRNPENFFAEIEQASFSPSHMVPGIQPSADKMLQGRLFSYPDAHRYRVGVNYKQIPVNRPIVPVNNAQRDGPMVTDGNQGSAPNYLPNSQGTPAQTNDYKGVTYSKEKVVGDAARHVQDLVDDDFVQPGNLYRLLSDQEKTYLIDNIVGHLGNAKSHIQRRQVAHFKRADPEYGQRVEDGLKKFAAGKN
ncbi:MAG: catalase [Piptocephalis tieghemiana]|nr:MAG: catalase [Piptocephalis tieghemiana]